MEMRAASKRCNADQRATAHTAPRYSDSADRRTALVMSRSLLSVLLAGNYSGPSQLNRDLHSLPDCTYTDSTCNHLPWTSDPGYMVSDAGAAKWGERLLWAAMIPFVVITLWILVDTVVRWVRFCCCRHKKGAKRTRQGCCTRFCCWGCADAFPSDEAPDDAAAHFISPAARVSSEGQYGSTGGAFPDAEVASKLGTRNSIVDYSARRGGTAGQTTDAFVLMHDANNPFNSSSRVIAVSARDFEVEGHRAEEQEARIRLASSPDHSWSRRMNWSWFLLVLVLGALGVSILFCARADDSFNAVRNDIIATQEFLGEELAQGSIRAVSNDVLLTISILDQMLATAGPGSSNPLTPPQTSLINGVIHSLQDINPVFLTLQTTIQTQAQHGDDLRVDMANLGLTRQLIVYIAAGTMMLVAFVFVLMHSVCRRRPGCAVSVSTLYALVLILLASAASIAMMVAVGFSDVCMDPLTYGTALLNATYTSRLQDFNPEDKATWSFYINCPQALDGFGEPLDTFPQNPLYQSYVAPAWSQLTDPSSGSVQGQMQEIESMISKDHPADLGALGAQFREANGTLLTDGVSLQQDLGCQVIHSYVVDALENACHPFVKHTLIVCALQCKQTFPPPVPKSHARTRAPLALALHTRDAHCPLSLCGCVSSALCPVIACLFLLIIRCCVWMRRRRSGGGDLRDDFEGSDDDVDETTLGSAERYNRSLEGRPQRFPPSEAPFVPFAAGPLLPEGKESEDVYTSAGSLNKYQQDRTSTSWNSRTGAKVY